MTPTRATSVRTYGSVWSRLAEGCRPVGRRALEAEREALEKPKRRQPPKAPNGRQLPKMTAASAMKPRPARHVLVERVPRTRTRGRRRRGRRAFPRGRRRRSGSRKTEMPTVSAAFGCSPTERMPQPERRLEEDDPGEEHGQEHEPDHQVQLAEDVPEERNVLDEPEESTSGISLRELRRPSRPVDGAEEVAGDAEREEVDREAADDLVGAQVDAEEGVDEREQPARGHRAEEAELPLAGPGGDDQMPKKAPASIIPSRPMFTTPGALGEDAAHGGERERRGEAQGRGEERRCRRRRRARPRPRPGTRARRRIAASGDADRPRAELPLARGSAPRARARRASTASADGHGDGSAG